MYLPDQSPGPPRPRLRFAGAPYVGRNVWLLGLTSLITDVSSEMVMSVLPAYLVLHLGLSPLGFGAIDGVYQGVGSLVRWVGGAAGDRWRRHKEVAVAGYALSAAARIALLLAGGAWTAIAGAIAIDRLGKGIRTAPRDALISLSSDPRTMGMAFGLHRTLDAIGAFLGPIVALAVLWIAPRSFDSVFVVSFCVAIVGVALIVLFVENVPAARTSATEETLDAPSPFRAARQLFGVAVFRNTTVAASALALTTVSDGFIFLTLQRSSRFGLELFPVLALATAASYFLFAAPAGRLADSVGRSRVFLGGHAALLLVYALLWLRLGTSAVGIFACVAILGLYYAMTDGVLAAAVSASAAPDVRGTGLAVAGVAVSVLRALAAIAFGGLWTAFGIDTALACFAVGLSLAVVLAGWLLSRPERGNG